MNLNNRLQAIYSFIAPKGSKRHSFTHTFFRRLLNIRYKKWVQQHDLLSFQELDHINEKIRLMPNNPIISVIMPVFNPNLSYLEQAIQSVRRQVYAQWELCIADDASTIPGVHDLIQKHTTEDDRIKPIYRDVNGHISAASNSALKVASGDFIALLDQDDMLHPLAFYYVAEQINDHPNSVVIYSDEDKITSRGSRISPYFKSDFDEDLFFCQNMVSHLGVYHTKNVREIGGFRLGLEGSQDYDLMLRLLERINPKDIYHIPRVLYHWRISSQSVAERVEAKPYALKAGEQALTDHLNYRGLNAIVKPFQKYGYQIHYKIPVSQPSVEVIFYQSSNQPLSRKMLLSLLGGTEYTHLTVNCPPTEEMDSDRLSGINDDRMRRSNIVFGQQDKDQADLSFKSFNADVIVIINPHSLVFSRHWLERLLSILFKPGVGAVSPQLVDRNGLVFSSGIILGTDVIARHIFHKLPYCGPDPYFGWANLDKGYSALPPGCLLVKTENLIEVGGLNQSLFSETAQIIDLCLNLKEKGLRNVTIPGVQVTVDADKRSDLTNGDLIQNPSDRDYFRKNWMKWLKNDPAFNPNLTLRNGKPIVSNNPRINYHNT